jgi:hypothetical protein
MSLSEKISKRTFPTTEVKFCLDAALSAERDQALRDLADARATDSGRLASNVAGAAQKRVAELEKAMQDSIVTVRVVGLPFAEYNKIMRAHPPRKGKPEGLNPETFFPDVVYKSGWLVEDGKDPIKLADTPRSEWDALVAVLTDAEFDDLAKAVNVVNRTLQEVGFLGRGSGKTEDSSGTSESPAPSE